MNNQSTHTNKKPKNPSQKPHRAPIVLVFLQRQPLTPPHATTTPTNEVLLGYKKQGFGAGKYVGIGGHIKPGEKAHQAATRETQEETGVYPTSLHHKGQIDFIFPTKPQWDMTCTLYTCTSWNGHIEESDEIRPEWFNTTAIPYHKMWDDSKYWLPQILTGKTINATVIMDNTNQKTKTITNHTLPDQSHTTNTQAKTNTLATNKKTW